MNKNSRYKKPARAKAPFLTTYLLSRVCITSGLIPALALFVAIGVSQAYPDGDRAKSKHRPGQKQAFVGAPRELIASYYSVSSLKAEGTWKTSKGVMANGEQFSDGIYCCATRLYPLGTMLRITNLENSKAVVVEVTDRIGKRFADTRIDLSPMAFRSIAELEKGLVAVKVEVLLTKEK